MTRMIYDFPIEFETNGDCSRFQLNFPEGYQALIKKLKVELTRQGFPVWEPTIKEDNSIIFSTLAMMTTEARSDDT